MVEQIPNLEENVSPNDANCVYLGTEITNSDAFLSSGELFPFLDLRSEGLSNLASLHNALP